MSIVKSSGRLLTLVLLCLWNATYALDSGLESHIDLTKSFRLRVNLIVEHDNAARYKYAYEESYSSEQNRTRIRYASLDHGRDDWFRAEQIPASGELIACAAGYLLWSLDESSGAPRSCKMLSQGQYKRLCYNQAMDELAPILFESSKNALRGPSAVLLLIELLSGKLKRVNMLNSSIRNTPCAMFAYLSDKFQLHSLYTIKQVEQQQQQQQHQKQYEQGLTSQLPMRVILDLPNGLHLEYDFLQYETGIMNVEEGNSEGNLDRVYWDKFSIERATGCSAYTSNINEPLRLPLPLPLPFPASLGANQSFSFTARVPSGWAHEETTCWVAYLDELNVMRVRSESAAKSTSTLVDFNLGTTHHVLERTEAQSEALADAALDQLMGAPMIMHMNNTGDTISSCILLESPRHNLVNSLNLLAGATGGGQFIYLGHARVRGIWTHAYEAYNTSWPSWLVQPVAHTKSRLAYEQIELVEEKRRNGYWDFLEPGILLTTVVYLSQHMDNKIINPTIVQLEIFRIRANTKQVLNQVTIPILEFTWSPAQVNLASLSMLANKCPNESEQHGQIELLLSLSGTSSERAAQLVPPNWLRDNQLRNMALVSSIQSQMKIPISMIDLENFNSLLHVEPMDTYGRGVLATILKVIFKFSFSNKRSVAKMAAYGLGRVKKLYQFGKLYRSPEATSLQACFYLAAHRKLSYTFFAYSQRDLICTIDFGPNQLVTSGPTDDDDDDDDKYVNLVTLASRPRARAFELDSNGSLEIYFVHHELESNPSVMLSQLYGPGPTSQSHAIGNSQRMQRMTLNNPEDRNSVYNLIVQSLEFTHLNNNQQPFTIDDVILANTNKFVNFGLVPDGQLAMRAAQDNSGLPSDIEGCRAACLVQSSCKAYSWCPSGASLECVLSRVDFKPGSDLLLQLVDIQQKRPPANVPIGYRERHVHNIWLNASHSVRVKRQVGCLLHNKLYLDMFHTSPGGRHNLAEFDSLKPVDGRDQCAQRCYWRTLKVFGDSEHLLANTKKELEQLFRVTKTIDENAQAAQVETILTSQRNAAQQMCKEFYYLDAINLHNLHANIRQQYQLLTGHDDETQGYCLVMQSAVKNKSHSEYNSREATIDGLERYDFKFELLYERKKSVRLLPSKLLPAELKAYLTLMTRRVPANIFDLEPLWGMLNERKNLQTNAIMGHMDESMCASLCTTQSTGPWPACKSFDLIVIASGLSHNGTPSSVCLMNSIAMEDALDAGQEELIVSSNSNSSSLTHVHWHYEPRSIGPRFSGGKIDTAGVSLPGEMFMAQRAMHISGLPSTMILCICLIGSFTGIVMGLNLGLKYSANLSSASSGLLLDPTAGPDQDFSLSIEVDMINSGNAGADPAMGLHQISP